MTPVFLEAVGPAGAVTGVDVADLRRLDAGNDFSIVDGTVLPFPSGTFDVVVSNHVIEHVGDLEEQGRHLRAIRSVLKPDGVAYLGMPSRWSLVEPHFRLPMVSWLPRRLRTPYVRIARRGRVYDVEPRAPREYDMLAAGAGLDVADMTTVGLRLLAQIEPDHWATSIIRRLPPALDRPLGPMLPIQIRLLRPIAE
jgi:SAM-dependent methyltransferase